jgi:hypothetical protein
MRWRLPWPWSSSRRPVEPVEFVDTAEHERRRLIREAEYQQALDAQAKILRVSGKVEGERRQVAGVVRIVRVKGEEL